MSISLINHFIQTRAPKWATTQAWEFLDNDHVVDFLIHDDGRTAEATVCDGKDRYTVVISNFRNMNIDAHCECSEDRPKLCAHRVATLYRLLIALDTSRSIPIPRRKVPARNSSQPLLLEGFENLSRNALSNYTEGMNNLYTSHVIRKIQLSGRGLSFVISSSYDGFEYLTQVYAEGEKYYTYCSCDQKVKVTCEHERLALFTMVKAGRNVLQYFEPGKQASLLKLICEKNDIPEKYASNSYIQIDIDEANLKPHVTFQGALKGLVSEGAQIGETNFYDVFGQKLRLEKKNVRSLFDPVSDKNTSTGFVFLFYGIDEFDNGIAILCAIAGKANRKGNNLTSGIREITVADIAGIKVSEQEREAIIICQQLGSVDDPDDVGDQHDIDLRSLHKKHKHFRRFFELLIGHPMIYTLKNVEYGIRKSNLVPIRLSPDFIEVGAKLCADDDFISLVPELKISDQVFDIHDENIKRRSDFIWEYQHELFLLKSVTMIEAINFIEQVGIMKSLKTRIEEFISKIVIPFSERFNIEIEGLQDFDTDETFLKPQKKQVFLSEFDGYILFTPVVVYNHKKEAEIMTGGNFIEHNNGQVHIFKRDLEFENEFLKFLRNLHPDFIYQEQESAMAIQVDGMLQNNWFFDAFEQMKQNDVEVLGLQKLKSFNYSPYRARVNTGIKSGQDWFDVNVEVSFGEYKIPLAKLRRHILNKEKFIRLGDGSVGMLPDEWVEKLEKYFRAGEVKDDEIKVSKLRFGIIDELFEKIDDTSILQELAEKKKCLESFTEISKVRKPNAIKAKLRDYQKEGINWLNFLNEMGWGGILADDMGLGKTLQILSLLAGIKNKRPKTSLVVVPTTLIFNWQNEIQKFYPTLKVLFYYGSKQARETENFKNYNLVVTTYGLMVNDIEELSKVKFNYVILDESQAIKNPLSKRYKAACLLQGKNKLTLTGTPIENNTFDLFAQMSFVNPGFLGTQKSFKDHYSSPIDKDKDAGRANELRKIISPFVLRRTKEQVATELPPKTEDVIYCQMDRPQREVYEQYKMKYRAYLLNKIEKDGMGKTKMSILEGLLKLRQICNSPQLMGKDANVTDESVKLDEMMRQINEKTGAHKIVVFSQFVKMLKMIEKELQHENLIYEYFDGSSSQKKRRESVERFQQDEKCRIFLISLKAGGTGINLTAADYVYIFDPWWNPAVENQAIDRTYRIGQDKKVFAYRMICKDTVEEKIMKYQEQKKALAADIIRTDESFVKHLDKESIMELFG